MEVVDAKNTDNLEKTVEHPHPETDSASESDAQTVSPQNSHKFWRNPIQPLVK